MNQTDDDLHRQIELLEHQLEELRDRQGRNTPLSIEEQARITDIQIEIDRTWDLLRQRAALRHAGLDPNTAVLRDPEVVEGYEQ